MQIVELAGMAAGGTAAFLAMVTAGRSVQLSAVVGFMVVANSCAAVLQVRAAVRENGSSVGPVMAVGLLMSAAAVAAWASPWLAVAFAHRLPHAVFRCVVAAPKRTPHVIGVLETAHLSAFLGLLAVGLGQLS